MAQEDEDRAAFQVLWTLWKEGKGKAEAEAEKRKLLATATILLGDEAEGYCEGSLRYLRRVRENMLQRACNDAGHATVEPVVLYRGIRGGPEAAAFRVTPIPPTHRLLSYSTRHAGGLTFASMGNDRKEPGLIFTSPVPASDIVFFEDPDLCNEYPTEYEVLVLHRVSPDSALIVESEVRPRAKISTGTKIAK